MVRETLSVQLLLLKDSCYKDGNQLFILCQKCASASSKNVEFRLV